MFYSSGLQLPPPDYQLVPKNIKNGRYYELAIHS